MFTLDNSIIMSIQLQCFHVLLQPNYLVIKTALVSSLCIKSFRLDFLYECLFECTAVTILVAK